MVITISGLDGAGKSSIIEGLKAALERQNQKVTVCHMNRGLGVYACGRLLVEHARTVRSAIKGSRARSRSSGAPGSKGTRQSGRQTPSRALARRLKNALLWNRPVRKWIYVIDVLIFLAYWFYVVKARKHVLVMDRYFYDRLVDVADGRSWLGLRLLSLITPTPSVSVLLEVSPEEAYARKGEYSVEYLRRRQTAYKKVFSWVPSAAVLVNTDLEATRRAVTGLVMERMVR